MSGIFAYEREPYRTELETVVVEVGETGGQPWAVLEDTVLYPEGGGQPADHGWLGEARVVDTRKVEGAIRHALDRAVPPGPATVRLDWARRFDHMQQHTGQHLLTAIALGRFGWRTTAFHLGPVLSDIELDVPALTAAQLEALEEAVAAEIRAARPVRARRVSPAEATALPVRSRLLPEGFAGDLRLVEIEGIDLNTCGGTHVRSTAEIEGLKLVDTEPMRGGTRVFFVAGGRLRRRLGAHEARNAALRTVLDTGDDELVDIARLKLEQLGGAQRRVRQLEEQVAEARAAGLAASPERVVEAHFDGADGPFLQKLARAVVAAAPAKAVLLTASRGETHLVVLAAGESCPVDVPALGRQVLDLLAGKGGGGGRLVQGKAGSLARREAAVDLVRRAAGS
ncbi:MAG TPA: alanyl-tRNA editing protein [Thermoanaerobaculaceae bacterium]|nr:alanyl-tRNA editing protein [Thermoanaerobaculaceae bacterium]HRS17632.1 alanyl-tRNA editing protein [Thermoanaerobaculaceae bacterium]